MKHKMKHKPNNIIKLNTIITLAVFAVDVLGFAFSYFTGHFNILIYNTEEKYYYIDTNLLGIFVAMTMIAVLSLYHTLHNLTTDIQVNQASKKAETKITEQLGRVEAHLINYGEKAIEYKYLSSIENDIGANDTLINNEIWVITNDFEEQNDTPDGINCRNAIVSNLYSNVLYYYIVPQTKREDMEHLCFKIKDALTSQYSGKFYYIFDDVLDFIPAEYFDIVIYLKKDKSGKFIEKSESIVCYCFSKRSDNYFYTMVEDENIRNQMFEYIKNYRVNHNFINGLTQQQTQQPKSQHQPRKKAPNKRNK